MSATYNWAYRPGITNKYGIDIPATADDVRPGGFCFVALSGNDQTGNGSRRLPYRTPQPGQFNILGSGTYRLIADVIATNIVGDGDVMIDGSYTGFWITKSFNNSVYNIYYKGNGAQQVNGNQYGTIVDCIFDGVTVNDPNGSQWTNVVFVNCSTPILFNQNSVPYRMSNVTFYKCKNIQFSLTAAYFLQVVNMVFHTCNITFNNASQNSGYSLFYQCNFRLAGAGTAPVVLYPNTPPGFTYYTDINTLKADFLTAYPAATDPFAFSIIADPLFNNTAINDFTLAFNSPAKNLSYFGTYAGARSIAYPIKASAAENTGGFELSSAVNLTVADDSITLINMALDAHIDTKVILNSLGRELLKLPTYGFNADRNGQYIDSIPDLDMVTRSPGDSLNYPASYLVENGAVSYNGNTQTAGSRFTTVAGQSNFTSSTGGVLREILEVPQRHTIMARFTDGGSGTIEPGTALTPGYYYYVAAGSATYNGDTYNAGTIFKAVNVNAFSGTATVQLAFSTESFQHYELGTKPTSNNVGDSQTGAIGRGNGDPDYVRGGLGIQEFPINAKFIQIRYYIRVNNLKSV